VYPHTVVSPDANPQRVAQSSSAVRTLSLSTSAPPMHGPGVNPRTTIDDPESPILPSSPQGGRCCQSTGTSRLRATPPGFPSDRHRGFRVRFSCESSKDVLAQVTLRSFLYDRCLRQNHTDFTDFPKRVLFCVLDWNAVPDSRSCGPAVPEGAHE
jgi:hypothetical protein